MKFLEQLAEQIVGLGVSSFQDMAIILPNKRAQRMLLHEIAKLIDKPVFAPTIFAINDFIETLSPLKKIDQLELLTQLFASYKSCHSAENEDFNDFLSWAVVFLNDINDIDLQIANGEDIFNNLADEKEFSIPFGQGEISESQKHTIDFYKMLSGLYIDFKSRMLQQQTGYEGLVYRDCAENMSEYIPKLSFKKYVFAGFHVLSPSELKIVYYLKEHFETHFYFDIDPFYCDFNKKDDFTTAFFIKQICDKLSLSKDNICFKGNDYVDIQKDIQVVGTSKAMNQIYYAVEDLQRIQNCQGNLDDTAVVLADECLLLPFLTAYNALDANITMGVPVSATMTYILLMSFLDLYQNGSRYAHCSGGSLQLLFPHRDTLSVLRNPLIKKYCFQDENSYNQAVMSLDENQRAFFTSVDLPKNCMPNLNVFPDGLLPSLFDFFTYLRDLSAEDSQDRALLTMFTENLTIVQDALQPLIALGAPLTLSLIKFAIRQQLQGLTMSLQGDPMKGLQIMGLLETRTLDFKNVIMLSVNEGILPSGISYNSLLPFDYKYNSNTLPIYLYKDQVYAYHFFRLLQRAEHVVLLYDNDSKGKLAEKSRFISQLEFEVKERQLSNIHFHYPSVSMMPQFSKLEDIVVQKSPDILVQLAAFPYSATALNLYINCPLQFYFQDICGLYAENDFDEKIESNIIGNVVHAIFQSVFDEIKMHPANCQDIIQNSLANVDDNIKNALLSIKDMQLTERDLMSGRLYLATQMIRNDVTNYLNKVKDEFKKEDITLLGNELQLFSRIEIDGERNVVLKGLVDRLQYQNDTVVILDYKTGNVLDGGLKITRDSLETLFSDPKYKQFVQLIVYTILVKDNNNLQQTDKPVRCGIISIQDVNKHSDSYIHYAVLGDREKRSFVNVTDTFDSEQVEDFRKLLTSLLSEILNPDIPFRQVADKKYCKLCDFKHICQR